MAEQHFMKTLEKAHRTVLPKKTYAVIRVDGKGFSKYTKGLEKPFDAQFTKDMQAVAKFLCEQIDGAHFAYTQSDEISVVFSDLRSENTEMWFGGQVQKIVSIVAALATAKFNELRPFGGLALFDARVHPLDGIHEVLQYVQWRQSDAIRNSVGMLAGHHFSHRKLMGASVPERLEMLGSKNVRWLDLDMAFRQGSLVFQREEERTSVFIRNGEEQSVDHIRKVWDVCAAYTFSHAILLERLLGVEVAAGS